MRRVSVVLGCFIIIIITLSFLATEASVPHHSAKQGIGNIASSQGGGLYPIYLVEHNLPAGMLWYAYIGPQSQQYYSQTPQRSTTPVIEFQEAPGNYSFSTGASGPYMPTELNIYATVVDKPVTVNIYFVEQYNVSVSEVGVPHGYNWELYLTDVNNSNNNGGVSGPPFRTTQWMYVSSGTYRLQLGSNPVNGVSIMGDTGNITVTDGPVHKTVRFYKVNITEEGLPGNSTDWGFPYSYSGTYSNGTQFSRSGFYPNSTGPITLYLPNATYSIHPVSNGYYSTPLDFRLNGKLLNLTETFHKVYHVTFVEHNLTGSNAEYWKVGGFPTAYGMSSPYIVGASAETFSVPNGTFSFNVTGLSDYETTINGSIYTVKSTLENQNSTFTVNGSNTVVNLYFNVTETPANNYRNGPGLSSLYGIIAIMSIITGSSVAASVAYFRLRRR